MPIIASKDIPLCGYTFLGHQTTELNTQTLREVLCPERQPTSLPLYLVQFPYRIWESFCVWDCRMRT
jgi:hypothetical protein